MKPYLLKKELKMKRLTPVKAIRAKCLECACNQYKEVRFCVITACPLHRYRLGKRKNSDDINLEKRDIDFKNSSLN